MKKQAQQGSSYLITIAVLAVVLAISAGALFCILFQSREKARKYDDYLQLGQKYLSEMKYEDAILVFQDAVRLDPKRAEAYTELAELYVKNGMYDEAEEVLRYAEKHVSENAQDEIASEQKIVAEYKAQEGQKKTDREKKNRYPSATPGSVPATETAIPTPQATPTPLPTATQRPTATPEPTKEKTLEPWQTAYIRYIEEVTEPDYRTDSHPCYYELIDLDRNGIPELLIQYAGYVMEIDTYVGHGGVEYIETSAECWDGHFCIPDCVLGYNLDTGHVILQNDSAEPLDLVLFDVSSRRTIEIGAAIEDWDTGERWYFLGDDAGNNAGTYVNDGVSEEPPVSEAEFREELELDDMTFINAQKSASEIIRAIQNA